MVNGFSELRTPTLYVINNGKVYADPSCVAPRIPAEVNASFRSVLYGKGRDEFYRIYFNCLETGVQFRMAAVPQDVPLGLASLRIDRADIDRTYVSSLERMQYAATIDMVESLAGALGVTAHELLTPPD